MSVFSSIKNWFKKTFGGGGSSSGRSSSRSASSSRANRVSNYGGGGARSYRDYSGGRYKADYEDRQEREKRQRQEQAKKRQATTDALAAISKRTDALSSGKSPSTAASATHATSGQGTARVIKKIEQKATPPDPKQKRLENSKTLQQIAADTKKNRAEFDKKLKHLPKNIRKDVESYHKATGNKYNPDTGNKAHDSEARRRVKSGDYQSDPNAARWEYEAHPRATMALRTAANAAAFGVPDVVIKKAEPYMNPELRESEDLYRKAQKDYKGTRKAAEFVGALVGYGGTANAFERAGARAVERAAATRAGKRLGAEALRRTMTGTGTKAALTRSLVGDAIQDSTLGLLDTATDVAERDDLKTPADYVRAIAEGQLLNYGMGLAGNAVAHGLPVAGRAWRNFADESRKLRFVPDGVGSGLTDDGRRLIMNGGTSRSTRLAGWGAENGFAPKKLSRKATTAPSPEAAPQRTTADILQGYSSRGSKKKLSEAEKRIKQFVSVGDTKAAREEVNRVVDEVVRNTKVEAPVDEVTKEIKATLKNTPISISNKGKLDAGYASGSFNEFRKGNFGSLTIKNDGTPVDDVWMALQERYGTTLFPDDIANPSDQLQYLADLAKSKNKEYSDLLDDEIINLRDELSNSLWESANKGNDHAPWNMSDEEWQTMQAAGRPIDPEELAELERRGIEEGDINSTPNQYTSGEFFETLDSDFPAEAWLGRYGHITRNEDGTYNLFVNGFGDKTLNRQEVEAYIDDAVKRLNADEEALRAKRTAPKEAKSDAEGEAPKAEAKPEKPKPKARKRQPSGSERRLEEVRKEIKASDAEVDRLKAEGKDTIEQIRVGLKLRDEAKKLERNIRRAEKAREKRATDKAVKKFLDEKAAKKATETKVEPKTEAKAEAKAEEPKATPKTEEPKSEIVAKGEATETGKNTEPKSKSGERTEFRRGEGETAKEKARNKRTAENKSKATQESFDKDFADFEKKVNENRAKASQLEGRLRAAATAEEKQAIRDEIRALDDEIKRMHRKASLKYHPDRGGSNEWMQKFNGLYDDYTKRVYSSRGFKGASSKSSSSGTSGARSGAYQEYRQRYRSSKAQSGSTPPPKSGAGNGGGNTPPPRGGASEAGERGFKKPKGKAATPKEQRTVYNVEDLVNKKRQRTSDREKIEEAYHVAKRKIVNSMASFEDANLKNVKSNPEKWSANNAAVDKTRRHGAIAGRSIKEGQLQANGRRYSGTVERVGADGKTYKIENGKSIMQIYDGMDAKTETAFDAYLLLKHAPDRIREGTPIFDRIKLASNESLNDVKVVNREADRLLKEHPEFAKRAEEIYQYTQNELENRVRAGLLSQETASKWMKDHPFYVPTGRDGYFNAVHGNHKGVIGADPIKAAKGSDLDIRSIKEQLVEATNRNWRDITTNNLLEKYFGDAVKSDLSVDDGLELLNNTVGLSKSADGRRFYAKIFRDGEMHRVEIDKRFYDDLDDLYKNGSIGPISDTVASASSKFSGLFKKLVTSWNPFFMPKNFSRDIQDAIINTRQTKEFFESLGPAAKELSNDGEFLRAFRDSGVSQANLVNLDESLTNGKGGVFGKALDKFATLNEAVETWPRLAEFMATIKKAGYKKLDDIPPEKYTDLIDMAAANAADVTVNFARSGSVGKNLNKGLVPFFNPSVQGWSKFIRNFREQRGLKQILGTIAKASTLGAGTVWINNTWLEDNPNYQRISARDKATNYIIPWVWGNDRTADNTDTFVKIPRGRFAAVYGLATVNAKNENEMGWAEMVKVGKDQIAPVDPLESSVYAPFLLAKKNETWYGSPIVPESIKNDTHPSEEYDQNTSYLGRALGKATENLPKELQISPKKADYIIDAESGVIGDFLLPALTPSRQGGGKGVIGKAGPAVLNVAKRQFTIDSTTQNDLSSRFYDKMQTAEDNKKSSKATDKDTAEYKRMNAYQKEVSTLTTAIRDLQAGDRATKQEDIRGLQEVRNKMMQDALDGKKPPSSAKAMDAVQKYVGTSYAIDKFGSSADKEAMKVYGASVYGNISEKEMQKKIDADKDFYKGVRAVGKLEDKLAKATGSKATSNLSKAVALAEVGASDELFGAYEGTKKSRTETDIKMDRARNYIADGGSTKEFVKLEKARKTLGKLSDYDKEAELDNALAELKSGKINEAEYYQKQGEIKYNANISYVGLATSLAESNAPSRGYVLYDIKAKNVQKGINLAAMGFTARDYREMAKAVDADGNGYPKKQEIIDYVNSRNDIEDKATLYDALYYYKSSYNPFGTPTNYTREQAAENGKARGVAQISDEKGALNLADDESSSKSGYRGYRRRYGRRRWRSYGRSGSSGKAKVPTPKTIKASSLKKGEALVSKKSSSSTKVSAPKLERVKAKIDLPEAKW